MQKENQKELQMNRINITYGITYIVIPGIIGIIWSVKEQIITAIILWIIIQIATSTQEWKERTGY